MSARINIRSWGTRAAAVAVATGAVATGVLAAAGNASATTSTLVHITKLSTHKIATNTANQLITVTGTGFSESAISAVHLKSTGSSPASVCTTDPTYIVLSPTSLAVKTAGDCATATNNIAVDVVATDGDALSAPTNAAMALDLVDAPTVADNDGSAARPIMTDAGYSATYANQVTSAPANGGTVIRVYASSTYKWTSTSAYPLTATFGGAALSKITIVGTGLGNYFTAVTGAVPAANQAAPVLKVTDNGVTSTISEATGASSGLAAGLTHDFSFSGNGLTVSPTFGPLRGGTVITVTGSGFTSGTVVQVGGVNCTSKTLVSASKITCVAPAGASAAPVRVTTTVAGASVDNGTNVFTYTGTD